MIPTSTQPSRGKDEGDEERSDINDQNKMLTPIFASAHSSTPHEQKPSLSLDTPTAFIKVVGNPQSLFSRQL